MKKQAADYVIRDVYTDNLKSDGPLLTLATRNQYHVVKGEVIKINQYSIKSAPTIGADFCCKKRSRGDDSRK